MSQKSEQKITVITGGAGGMGLATAKIMGQNHHVVICDVKQDRLDASSAELEKLGIKCEALFCDITDRKSVNDLVNKVSAMGKVTSLIHTAGVSPQMGNAELIMRINTLGTMNMNEAFYEIAEEGFCCVNVSSMAAHLLPGLLIPKRAYKYAQMDKKKFFKKMMSACKILPKKQRAGFAYSISKNFVVWYSKAEAARFGEKGARILSVSPGSFDTKMGRLEEKSGSAKMLEFAALKRFGKPEEVAELLAFCAGDKASYITGIDILCDGGVVACITPKDMRSLGKE